MPSKKIIYPAIGGALLSLILVFTYGKWSLLSYKYGHEFIEPIRSALNEGCPLESPVKLRVTEYSKDHARVFMKGESGSTYLIFFNKLPGQWSLLGASANNQEESCNFEILNSTLGGSADTFITLPLYL